MKYTYPIERLNQHLKIIGNYYNDNNYAYIFKSLQLIPSGWYNNDFNRKIILERSWSDIYRNTLILNKDRTISIILNDLTLSGAPNQLPEVLYSFEKRLSFEETLEQSMFFQLFSYKEVKILLLIDRDDFISCWIKDLEYNERYDNSCSPLIVGWDAIYKYYLHSRNKVSNLKKINMLSINDNLICSKKLNSVYCSSNIKSIREFI